MSTPDGPEPAADRTPSSSEVTPDGPGRAADRTPASSGSVGRAAATYGVFRLGIFVAVLVPLVVLVAVLGGPPFAYLGAVAVASVVSAIGALVWGRSRRDALEAALQTSRTRRLDERRRFDERTGSR